MRTARDQRELVEKRAWPSLTDRFAGPLEIELSAKDDGRPLRRTPGLVQQITRTDTPTTRSERDQLALLIAELVEQRGRCQDIGVSLKCDRPGPKPVRRRGAPDGQSCPNGDIRAHGSDGAPK